jgi:hypothetical protein
MNPPLTTSSTLSRRKFITGAAATGAGLMFLPKTKLFGANAPNNKLNIAMIGAWGRASQHYNWLKNENIVAVCDVDKNNLAKGLAEFPGATTYEDWRKCLDHKGLDAIICCTPDHTHAFITNWALNRDLHVFMEKPLAITVNEARAVRKKYLEKKSKLATQVGTFRHAFPNVTRVRDMIRAGAVGKIKEVHAWGTSRWPVPAGYAPAAGPVPAHLNFDLWLGPSPEHPYSPEYFRLGQRPGLGCQSYNKYWDFGMGYAGDWGSHVFDVAWNALDAELPQKIKAISDEKSNPAITPLEMSSLFTIPANSWRNEVRVVWHQGGKLPSVPAEWIDLEKFKSGVLFKGDQGFLLCDFDNRVLIPFGKDADLSYFAPLAKDKATPIIPSFFENWTSACKNGSPANTCCNFEYGSKMVETLALGLAAFRAGAELEYDGSTGRITNNEAANQFLTKPYRSGWTMEG